MLGATELRVHVASHGTELARMGLGLALASGSAPMRICTSPTLYLRFSAISARSLSESVNCRAMRM